MRSPALILVGLFLAGCTAPDSLPGAPTQTPTGDASAPPECPPIQASFVKLNLTGFPGTLQEAKLLAHPGASLVANDRPDCPEKRSGVPLVPGVSMPVENGRYHELRLASDVAVARVALDLPLASAGTLDVLVAPEAASARYNGARLLVTRAEIVEDPSAYSRVQTDATVPLGDSAVASRELSVASAWNEGIHVSFGVRGGNDTVDLRGLRAEIRIFSPNGTLAASRVLEAARTEDFRVDAPVAGAWRIELDTTPPAQAGASGMFHFAAVIDYDPAPGAFFQLQGRAGANR